MDRRRTIDGAMAPVLAKLVKLLAILCFSASLSILAHAAVWGILSFTSAREHGLTAVTHPERTVVETPAAPPKAHAVTVRSGEAPEAPAVDAASQGSGPAGRGRTDTVLRVIVGTSTAVGAGALCLLPVVLVTAFVTSLVRCPRAAAASMGGVLWSLGVLALILPWSSFWPQVPWAGLFLPYATLIEQVADLEARGGPFAAAPLVSHVGVPLAAVAILVIIAWRCGEALHQELLAAESLAVDPALERDAARTAARGAFVPGGRTAASLAVATASPVPVGPGGSDLADEVDEPERAPRRLI